MPKFAIAIFIRPLVALAVLYAISRFSRWIYPLFPEGKVREVLYRKRGHAAQ